MTFNSGPDFAVHAIIKGIAFESDAAGAPPEARMGPSP